MGHFLLVAVAGCTPGTPADPHQARQAVTTAWQTGQHTVWEIDWPASPVGGPVTVETWRAGNRYRLEILESTAPALVGQTLVFNGSRGWRFNRLEPQPAVVTDVPALSPVTDALETIAGLLRRLPTAASREQTATLEHGPAQKIGLTFDNGDSLIFWLDQSTGLPVRIRFTVKGGQATLQARRFEPLPHPPDALFTPIPGR